MKKHLIFLLVFFIFYFLFFIFPCRVLAFDANRPNNKFGIHLAVADAQDIVDAAKLVNSSGGDWGYITLVIQENDRNVQKWQEIFDQLRELHLIPIIRLATKPDGAVWVKPRKEDNASWVEFLSSLNWVIKDRYVILFNEPNHAAEWGGMVDAYNYIDVSADMAQKLKNKNKDFFVMMAGLDAAAPTAGSNYQDEYYFLRSVFEKITPEEFEKLFDGWTSHSYPNPGFAGSPVGEGRSTVRNYVWELEAIRELGINKNLPVFITETGWDSRAILRDTVGQYLKKAYENIWLYDTRVIAVTPFILNYQGEPFLNFSWKLPSGEAKEDKSFYPQYYLIQSMNKTKGDPEKIERGELTANFPTELLAYSNYNFKLKLKNLGQAIWDKDDGYYLKLEDFNIGSYFFSDLKKIKPKQEVEIDLYLKTNRFFGSAKAKIILLHNEKKVAEGGDWSFSVSPLPKLDFKISLFPKLKTNGNDFEIQIFDEKEKVVFKKDKLVVKNGNGTLTDIQNIILDKKYRTVILKHYYLPRQEFVSFKIKDNKVKFKKMLPLDFNRDGKLDIGDFFTLIKNPRLFQLFFP